MKDTVHMSAELDEPPKKKSSIQQYLLTVVWLASFAVTFALLYSDVSLGSNVPWYLNSKYWQVKWIKLVDFMGGERTASIHGHALPRFLSYWGVAIPFLFVDITGKPSFMKKYKVQPGTNEPLSFTKGVEMLSIVLFNQVVVGFFHGYLHHWMMVVRGCPPAYELPTIGQFLFHIVLFVVLYEPGLYYSHRMLHHRLLYKRVHKMHHENTAVVVIDNHRVHWFEYWWNLLPHSISAMIIGSHMFTFWFFTMMVNSSSVSSHSGYHIPFLPSPEMHDWHHVKFNECFGGLGWLDNFHKTDTNFRKSVEFQRHRITFNWTPPREIWPDVETKQE